MTKGQALNPKADGGWQIPEPKNQTVLHNSWNFSRCGVAEAVANLKAENNG